MFELILLSRLRIELRLRRDDGSRFKPQCARRLAPWIMPVAPGPVLKSGKVSVLPHDLLLRADTRTFRNR